MNKAIAIIILFCGELCCLHTSGQPSFSSDEYINVIKLAIGNRYDIIKQELLSKKYNAVKDIEPYYIDNDYIKCDFKYEYPNNDLKLNFFNNPYFSIKCSENIINSETSISFINIGLCGVNLSIYRDLKRYIIYQLQIKDAQENFINDCSIHYGVKQVVAGQIWENPNFYLTNLELFIMFDAFNKGYSYIVFNLEYFKKSEIPIFNSGKIPLKKVGNINMISVEIGGKNYDYIIDTGASFLTITPELEDNLNEIGILRTTDYRGETELILADGRKTKYKLVIIPVLKIGSMKLENIEAVIIPNGSLLLGKSVLDKFKVWKIDNTTNQLIVE